MGWFSTPQDNLEDQIKIYQEIIDEKQNELEGLSEEGKSTAVDMHRQKLDDEIRQAKIQISQTKEAAEREGRDVEGYDFDMFDD